jgi:catechol 2,3-dioxygenase
MRIGHVHLKIRDMKQSIAFYQNYLGMKITENLNDSFVFMSAGEMHHELALQEVGKSAALPGRHDVGLYHVAFEVPNKQALIETYQKIKQGGIDVYPVDHRISWALYFNDPDGNGIEVYWDTRDMQSGVEKWEGKDRLLTDEMLK